MQSWLLGYDPMVNMDLNALSSFSFLGLFTLQKKMSMIVFNFEVTSNDHFGMYWATKKTSRNSVPLKAVSRSFQGD